MAVDLIAAAAEAKRLAEQKNAEAAKAQGAVEQIEAQMAEKFGVDTLEAADKLLVKLAEEEIAKAAKAAEALAAFDKNHGPLLTK